MNFSTLAFASEASDVNSISMNQETDIYSALILAAEDGVDSIPVNQETDIYSVLILAIEDGVNSIPMNQEVNIYSLDDKSAQTRASITGLGLGYNHNTVEVRFTGGSTGLVKIEGLLTIYHKTLDTNESYFTEHEFGFSGAGVYDQKRTYSYADWRSAVFVAKAYFSNGDWDYITSPIVVNDLYQ